MARAIVICTLLLIAFAGVLEASHFRYGTITWTKNATNPRAVTFNVNMGMRRSYYGAPNVGSTISDPQFCYGDGQCVVPTWTVNNVDLGLDLIYMSWTATKVYNGAGNFNAICSSCCRISTLRNNADGNYQFTSLVKLTAGEISGSTPINNSPVTAGLPIVPVQYGVVPFTYQIPSSDIDGDSRTFRMATSAELGGGVHPTGLTVSSSGLVTISSVLATGYWCTQQVIEDSFGNRVTVDYMLDVQPPKSYCNSTGGCSTPCQSAADCAACGGAASSCLNAKPRFVVRDLSSTVSPRTNRPTPAQNAVFTTLPGNPLTFYFTADDENLYKTATPVNIQFASLPTRAVRSAQVACTAANGCTYVGPYADPQTVTLTYSPIAADTGSHVICASAQSMANYLPYSQHCFTVVVANITDVCGDGIIGVTEACDGGVCCSADCKSFRAPGTQCGAPSGSCGNVPQCTGSSATCPAQGSMAPAGTICRASTGACDPAEFCTGSSPVCPSDSLSSGVCRASQGPCDQPEVCDGVSVDCPTDSFSSGSICRGSNGACDVAETCDGSSAACPADSFATGGVCRAANGDCDVAEVCSGSSAACPADSFAASSVVCRASNGDCDVADTCTGSSAACPADGFAASSVVCRASAGDCDVAESCTGSSASCPSDAFSAGNTCRASAGPCDVEEICDGVGASCPTDAFNTGFTCRSSAGPCDVAETCDGSSAACPSDAVAASTVTCRGAAGICDVDEVCDGVSVDCPVDAFVGAWMTQCRASAGNCDVEEWCDGTQADCPVDGFLSSNVTCRASVSTCDKAETCTGSTASCPTDAFAPTTTLCRAPVNSCDIPEYCTSLNSVCPVNAVNQSAACSTPKDYCTRNAGVGTPGNINYFCAGTTHYTQCVAGTGNFAAKSPCPSGTGCWCAEGVDCSFGGTTSPCTIQQTSTGSE